MAGKTEEFLKAFPYQVAGHVNQDPLRVTADGCVLKPVQRPPKGEREVVFYETIFDEKEKREEILQLRRFLPHYYGVVELDSSRYLKLENITRKFVLPCVMDMKIGKVTWEDDAAEEFKARRKNKWPLRDIVGFSILGYMVYNHKTCCYERYMREWCMKLASVADVEKTFHKFFGSMNNELKDTILQQLLTKLRDIEKWFRTQRLYRFIASSILIAYEGDSCDNTSGTMTGANCSSTCNDQASTETMQELNSDQFPVLKNCQKQSQSTRTLVEARMIDTAHVFTSSDVDSNYLFGLENIISVVERMRTKF